MTLLDAGDYYGMGHNEILIREALKGRKRSQVAISAKLGCCAIPGQLDWIGLDGWPAAVKNSFAFTLRRLGCVDPVVPMEETIIGIADMVKAAVLLSLKKWNKKRG